MKRDDFADIDTKTPSVARGYDYALGGTDNYAVDRAAMDQAENMLPGTMAMTRNGRRFLERVVGYLAADCGIRQFIDSGSGLPTQNNVHQIAQRIAPDSRVVYVDNDAVVIRHQKVSALAENAGTAFILADARDIEQILDHPDTRRLIDFSQPAAALYLGFLHHIPDEDDPWSMVRRMMDRLAPGSYLAISHLASDEVEVRRLMTQFITEGTRGNFGRVRTKQEVSRFFDGLEPVEPGLVELTGWRPDGRDEPQTLPYASPEPPHHHRDMAAAIQPPLRAATPPILGSPDPRPSARGRLRPARLVSFQPDCPEDQQNRDVDPYGLGSHPTPRNSRDR